MDKIMDGISNHAFLIIARDEFNLRETEIKLVQRVRKYFSEKGSIAEALSKTMSARMSKPAKSGHPAPVLEGTVQSLFQDSQYPEQTR